MTEHAFPGIEKETIDKVNKAIDSPYMFTQLVLAFLQTVIRKSPIMRVEVNPVGIEKSIMTFYQLVS